MSYAEYKAKKDLLRAKLKESNSPQHKQQLRKAIKNLDGRSKGRIYCRPIKGKLQEKNPKNCIRACCESQKVDSFPFTAKVFDYARAR